MIIDICKAKLDTIFLSSWYSESEADVFLGAGANHVIWIQRDKKVTDEACIKFSNAFYTSLFSEGRTPWESFNIAQQTLSITQNLEGQSALFLLKTKSTFETEHQCRSFAITNGVPKRMGKKNNEIKLVKNIPPAGESFVGRNHDICLVLRELKKTRLIALTGEPGIGKTAVAKFIANFIKCRDSEFIKNGVIFMNVINWSSLPMLKHKFINAYREGLGQSIVKGYDKKDTEILFNEVLNTISKNEILLIIDDAEDLLRTSKDMLKNFIDWLFEASSAIKLLLTSKIELISFLGIINGVKGRVIQLKPLSLMASEKLLGEKAGRNITREEKHKLQKMQPEKIHGVFKNAYQHLFDAILGGHPIAISLAANILSSSSLQFLYETLAKSNLMNTLAENTIGKATINNKLRFSLKLTMRLVQSKDVHLFFNLMGYFPGGVTSDGIDELWDKVKRKTSNSDWRQYYHFLSKASLVSKKTMNNKQRSEIYILVPVLKTLAEEFRTISDRKKVHRMVTKYFVDILEEILNNNSITK